MSTLSVEYAKSARSTCKLCKTKIEKSDIRIGTHTNFDDKDMTQWRHYACFNVTKKWKELEPTEIQGFSELEEQDQDKIIEHWENGGNTKKKTAKKTDKKTDKKAEKKKKKKKDDTDSSSEDSESEGEDNKYDSKKIKGYTEEEFNTYQKYLQKLEKWKNADLSQELKLNAQKITGTKQELILRVADGKTLGQIPKCHVCGGGRLTFDYKTGTYKCPGYMDDDNFVHCRKKFGMDEIERTEWISVD